MRIHHVLEYRQTKSKARVSFLMKYRSPALSVSCYLPPVGSAKQLRTARAPWRPMNDSGGSESGPGRDLAPVIREAERAREAGAHPRVRPVPGRVGGEGGKLRAHGEARDPVGARHGRVGAEEAFVAREPFMPVARVDRAAGPADGVLVQQRPQVHAETFRRGLVDENGHCLRR